MKQLDTEADRRVLVISDDAPFGKDFLPEAAREFFGEDRQDMSNIDEVFIEFRKNDFRKVYHNSSRTTSFWLVLSFNPFLKKGLDFFKFALG